MTKFLKYVLLEFYDLFLVMVLGKTAIKPWMKYKKIENIKEILIRLKPNKCLEWGGEYSTLYFPKILDNDFRWFSIEHKKEWYEKIKGLIKHQNVEVFYVHSNNYPMIDRLGDGDYSDLKDYIEFPSRFWKFDFIIVDGRARKDCLVKAFNYLDDNGVIVLHDANRKYYQEPFKLYDNQVLFSDCRKDSGGLWIGSKKFDLQTILDIYRHKQIWRRLDIFGGLI